MKSRRKFITGAATLIPFSIAGCMETNSQPENSTTEDYNSTNKSVSSKDKITLKNNTNIDIKLKSVTTSEPTCFTGEENEKSNISKKKTEDGYEVNFSGRKLVSGPGKTIQVETTTSESSEAGIAFNISEVDNPDKTDVEKCVGVISYTGVAIISTEEIDNIEITN